MPLALLLLCAPFALPQSKREGVIAGRLLLDDGRTLPGIEVMLERAGVSQYTQQMAVTDEEGGFKFTGVAPGFYTINAKMPGYIVENAAPGGDLYRVGDTPTIRLVKGGVITGRVTDETGEPLVGVAVAPQRLRGLAAAAGEKDLTSRELSMRGQRGGRTDDRGIYRIYGLPPGVYIVGIGGDVGYDGDSSALGHDAPTWYPSSPRDTAGEITVPEGVEVTGIDLRHRGEPGRTVSGTISGATESSRPWGGASVSLTSVEPGRFEAETGTQGGRGFVFYGVPDGEYELEAFRFGDKDAPGAKSSRRRMQVRGADIAGVDLKLLPLGSIAGRIAIEPKKCDPPQEQIRRQSFVEEVLLRAISAQGGPEATPNPFFSDRSRFRSFPNEKGEFRVTDLAAGRYVLRFDLPDENWYVRAVTPPAAQAARTQAPAPPGLNVKSGEQLSGVEIKIAEGAAGLQGKRVLTVTWRDNRKRCSRALGGSASLA